jgi:hypothetical protein
LHLINTRIPPAIFACGICGCAKISAYIVVRLLLTLVSNSKRAQLPIKFFFKVNKGNQLSFALPPNGSLLPLGKAPKVICVLLQSTKDSYVPAFNFLLILLNCQSTLFFVRNLLKEIKLIEELLQ